MAETDPQNAGNQEGQDRPDGLPENFKSLGDLVSSYKELERTLTSRSEREKELEQQIASYEEFVAQQQETTQQQPQGQQFSDQLYQAYENDPVGTMAWLAQQAAQQAIQASSKTQQEERAPLMEQQNELLAYAADQIVSQRLPDWSDYASKVGDAITEDPDLLPESAFTSPQKVAQALERVYKIVKYSDVENNVKSLTERQAESERLAKEQAQTLSGTNGRPLPPDEAQAKWEAIKNAGTANYADLVRNAS